VSVGTGIVGGVAERLVVGVTAGVWVDVTEGVAVVSTMVVDTGVEVFVATIGVSVEVGVIVGN
jgi:hypothetical protein